MPGVVVDAGHTLDDPRHPGQRPEIRGEGVRPCPLPQRPLHLAELVAIQLRLAARPPGPLQRADTTPLPFPVPPTYTLPTDLQVPGDSRQDHLAGSKQATRLLAPLLQVHEIAPWANMCTHAPSIRDHKPIVTILCEIQ